MLLMANFHYLQSKRRAHMKQEANLVLANCNIHISVHIIQQQGLQFRLKVVVRITMYYGTLSKSC